ncbi:YbaK/EbsC family protein [Arthrobacter sp.]|uniref:YbaK/EbsC family protein n=1 Tax=Arthrobacter sp. TaxID=1667 RepID=UPI003A901BB5
MAEPAAESWRPVIAALANAEQRLLLAEVIADEARRGDATVPARRREKGLAQLASAGLLAVDDDGEWRVDASGLRSLLSAPSATARPSSGEEVVDRFVRDGRIHTFPAKPAQRAQLLDWAARRALSLRDVLTEPEITGRLGQLTDDPAALRRYLVDANLVSRSPDGSAYRLADGATTGEALPTGSDAPAAAPVSDADQDAPAATAARALGLEVAVTRHGRVSNLAEAAAARGIEPRDLVKTLVVRRSDDDYVFVLVAGDRKFSWPKLRAVLGTNRVSMPDAAEAKDVTGYERGTITPFGAARVLPVYADRGMTGRRISIGGGAHGVGLTVDANAALAALDATIADLSDPPNA